MKHTILILLVTVLFPTVARAGDGFTVKPVEIQDRKAVFATIESRNEVAARARISGTVADLVVDEGDVVKPGQVIAKVGDEKLFLQVGAMDSKMRSMQAELTSATKDLERVKAMLPSGAVSKRQVDDAQTRYDVAKNSLKAVQADKNIVRQQVGDGDIHSPVAGRVLRVPVTKGSVIMPGETAATIAEENYILRISVPERHAAHLKKGDDIYLDGGKTGTITTLYPQIENGRVVADASADGVGDYFVGERVRVWVNAGTRKTIVIPETMIRTRFGIDEVTMRTADGNTTIVPVQRGSVIDQGDIKGVEILTGLHDGDVLVTP